MNLSKRIRNNIRKLIYKTNKMTTAVNNQVTTTQFVQYIQALINKGGPSASDLPKLELLIKNTYTKIKEKAYTPAELEQLKKAFLPIIKRDTIWGLCYLQPYGYPGDFEIIDKVHTYYVNPNPMYKKWDILNQESNGLKAVRNRKELFKELLSEYAQTPDFQVLNVASGPCRDVLEYLEANPNQSIQIDCLEHDKNAIEYATNLLEPVNSEQYQFIHANIFKFDTTKKYDFIWSAGLFDYFDDKTFVKIFQLLHSFLKPNGRLIVGNFCWKNETRYMMELVDWHLHYRTREELMALGKAACGEEVAMDIFEEEEGVNLFLRVEKFQ